MEILRACHSLFLKAPMIGELAAEGGLSGLRLPWEGSWVPKAV